MKRLALALILTCFMAVPALAGDIPTAGKASTQSASPTTQSPCVATTILLTVLSLIR